MDTFFRRSYDHHVRRPLERSGVLFVSVGLVALVVGLARLGVRFWRTALFLGAVAFLIGSSGRYALVEPAALVLVVLGVWRWLWPEKFTSWLIPRVRGWWRMWTRYAWRWPKLARRHRLQVHEPTAGQHEVPSVVETARLLKVTCTPAVDRLLIAIPAGLCTQDFVNAAPSMAHATRSLECRVRDDRPGRVWLELLRKDPLLKAVPARPIPDRVDLDNVCLGIREDGEPWKVAVRGTHILGVGSTGAGKGSVLHSMLRALAVGIRDGLVEPWGFDPKGGMELAFAKSMFARLFTGDRESMAAGLEECVALMDERTAQLAGVTRCHTPTVASPLRVIVIDELAALTALCDRKTAARVEKALGSLLTQGRAAGVVVVAFLQDPGKDVISYRNLFTTRIALRVGEANEVDMVLKEGARDRGALADLIPKSLPGVGYVRDDSDAEPIRVRAAYCTDDDIRALAGTYGWHGWQTIPVQRVPVSLLKTTGEATA